MRILIAEDDAALGVFLERGLRLEGHEVLRVMDGEAALEAGAGERFDLVVLDLSLPRLDGVVVLEGMRGRGHDAAVLVLTGRIDVAERVHCLDLGADDFLQKPFSFAELTARCRALMRRRERFQDPVLRHGDLELQRMERRVVQRGVAVELTVKEFALLEYLMLARGRTCSRAELLKEVWHMSPDAGTNVVDVYVNYLRKKLDGFASNRGTTGQVSTIETVRGEGYTLAMAGVRRPAVGAALPAGVLPHAGGRLLGGDPFGRRAVLRDAGPERVRASA